MLRADGSEFPAEVTVTQIIIEKQISYTVYVRDITARRRAEEMVVRLAAIVESSQDAIVGKDLNCRITSWNMGAELMYGYSANEAVGQDISILAPAGRSHEIQRIVEDLKAGRLIRNFETIWMAKNGKMIHVSLTARQCWIRMEPSWHIYHCTGHHGRNWRKKLSARLMKPAFMPLPCPSLPPI